MTLPVSFVEVWTRVLIASLEGAALIVVVLLVQRIFKRSLGPSWSFALWFVVLLRLSMPSLPENLWTWPRSVEDLRTKLWAIPSSVAAPTLMEPDARSQVLTDFNPSAPTSQPVPLHRIGPAGLKPPGGPSNWVRAVAWAWVSGAVILISRHWLGIAIFRRKLSRWPLVAEPRITQIADECRAAMGIRWAVEIRAAPDTYAPCLFGVFRPVLLMPANLLRDLSNLEWRNILLHEFAHLRRRDPLSNAWMSLAGIAHWFNPFVWWAIRRMRQDRELACDQLVLSRAGQAGTESYGATLLKLASYPAAFSAPSQIETIGVIEGPGALKARLLALRVRPVLWLNAAIGTLALGLLGSCALTRNPETEGPVRIDAINLVNFSDYPRALTNSNVLVRRQDDPGMWSQIPHGQQSLFGVPFEITGLVRLAGRNPQRINAWYFRPEVSGILIGRPFDRLYLLHATSYCEQSGTVIAKVRLNYTDGRSSEIPIAYGTHTLNYWRQRYESSPQPTDSDSRVAWTDKAPQGIAEYGNSLRLVVSSFKNPHPGKVVQSADLISTWSDASEIIVGMAVGGRALPQAWRDAPRSQYPKNDWQGVLRFRAVNAVTGKSIQNMELRVEVAEPGVHSRLGTYHTDADGWATLKYPHTDISTLTIWADHPDCVPRMIQWTRRQHGPFPREYEYRADPGMRIHGRVVDAKGGPLAGALVRIHGPALNFDGDGKEFLTMDHSYAMTDAEGRWNCSEIPKELRDGRVGVGVLHPASTRSSIQWLTADQIKGAEITSQLPEDFE